jgi:hypothetical protein
MAARCSLPRTCERTSIREMVQRVSFRPIRWVEMRKWLEKWLQGMSE